MLWYYEILVSWSDFPQLTT